jgi:hypothetical protein
MNPVANSISDQQTLAGMAPEQIDLAEQARSQQRDLVYQAATIVAILLCLLNF